MSQKLFDGNAHAALLRRLLTLALFAGLGFALLAGSARDAAAQSPTSPDLVISQVYTRGGEPGATFRNDFVEIFNRGNTTVNLSDYSLQVLVSTPRANLPPVLVPVTISFASSNGNFPVSPGKYVLYEFAGSGGSGALLPTPESTAAAVNLNLPATTGRVALVKGRATHPFAQYGCAVGVDASLADFFSYGPATCVEGRANFPAPTPTTAALRITDGCADTDNTVADFTNAAPNPRNTSAPARLCNLPAPANTLLFEVASADVNEGAGFAEIFVRRTGDTSDVAYFQYATGDNTASERTDYTTTLGWTGFPKGETRASFFVPITDDARAEGTENLTISLSTIDYPPNGMTPGARHIMRLNIVDNDATTGPGPVDATGFFVRQHYADFLSRSPDQSGFDFWTGEIEGCGVDAQCREVKRVNVSAAFFLSIEFQDTGYFAYRAYKAAFPDDPSRPRGFPLYRELFHDAQHLSGGAGRVVVGQGNWQERLEGYKFAYTAEFVTRPEFHLRYPASMTAAQFVDELNANTGGALSQAERNAEVSLMNSAGTDDGTRGVVFKHILEDPDFVRAEFKRAFVLMEYFGYLRRNPDEEPEPGLNFDGYDFWLGKLTEFNGNYIQAEMVKAFSTSDEYRQRFGQ